VQRSGTQAWEEIKRRGSKFLFVHPHPHPPPSLRAGGKGEGMCREISNIFIWILGFENSPKVT